MNDAKIDTSPGSYKIVIVGLGLIGGSMALDLRRTGFAARLIGVDQDPEHGQLALQYKLVDEIQPLATALRSCDLVVLAIPVTAIEQVLPRVLDDLPDHVTVTDVGSTKHVIVESVRHHPRRPQYVPSHPMAGTENSGPQAAIENLFQNKTVVLCQEADANEHHVEKVRALYRALGMRLIEMTALKHDRHVAFVSHLSHISSFMLANTVLDIEKNTATIFDLASGGFESTVRLAKSSPKMWLPIFEQNRDNIAESLQSYIEHLQYFHRSLVDNAWEKIEVQLKGANQIRRVLESLNQRGKQ